MFVFFSFIHYYAIKYIKIINIEVFFFSLGNESPESKVYVEQNTGEVNNMLPLSTVSNDCAELSQAEASNTSPVQSLYSPMVKFKVISALN